MKPSKKLVAKKNLNSMHELNVKFSKPQVKFYCVKQATKWTEDEDQLLKKLVEEIGRKSWKKVSLLLKNKTAVQCLQRWSEILKPGIKKGPWTIQEDRKLLEWVNVEGPNKWSQCSEFIKGRSGKQCRERWFNTLHPEVKKGGWNPEEDYIIFSSFSKFGSKWSKFANILPGRTENSIKNRFYSTLRRISSENNKKEKNENRTSDKGTMLSGASSLTELLKYFPLALEEKIHHYEEYKKNPEEKYLLTKKTSKQSRNLKNPTSKLIRTLDFNNDDNNNTMIKNIPTKPNIEELENAIEEYYAKDFRMSDENFENLEMKINNLMSSNDKSSSEFLNQSIQGNYKENINNVLKQLNELEKILNITKQELYDGDFVSNNLGKELKSNISMINNKCENSYCNFNETINNLSINSILNNKIPTGNNNNKLYFNDYFKNIQNLGFSPYNNFNNNVPYTNNVNIGSMTNLSNFSIINNGKSIALDDDGHDEPNQFLIDHMLKF